MPFRCRSAALAYDARNRTAARIGAGAALPRGARAQLRHLSQLTDVRAGPGEPSGILRGAP